MVGALVIAGAHGCGASDTTGSPAAASAVATTGAMLEEAASANAASAGAITTTLADAAAPETASARAVTTVEDAARPRAAAPEAPPDARLVDRHPSLAYYPGTSARLHAALAGADVRERLAALAESLAPYRWPDAYDWDRHGFIDLAGPRPGFVTRVSGVLVPQDPDRHDLGCAGGFLEGVRMAWLPDLAVEDLDRCEPAGQVEGGPDACDPEHDYGWLALANITRRLRPAQLPEGPRLFEFGPNHPGAVDRIAAPDTMHLCTVSHQSATRAKARYHHHMMIVAGAGDSVDVFDTTGARGVAYIRLPLPRFRRYCTAMLAASEEFRYISRSTRLTCVRVAG